MLWDIASPFRTYARRVSSLWELWSRFKAIMFHRAD
jgi:hypothetical protein